MSTSVHVIKTAHLQAIRRLLKALSNGLVAFDITVHVSGTYHPEGACSKIVLPRKTKIGSISTIPVALPAE
ncbi:hypothetical protein SNOG_02473 [Parastagonospora nodorum SN15]|uniref:Uncharacterized protein n=1 Tax=Phaeosphaeria nodorum (strain SN15 / ATCC MYA-4574 / FGSC 10173) TaxID=321614 RepID=Q0V0J1_PHANO|nr:hypothetical protein SNOG_02473 [Parastagonospora nodorum SN15]EAT90685.1 hypothetical protein SNOG_02473 [Parastagonospora nodorum SN15]